MTRNPSSDLPGIGDRLRTAREDAGLSQAQVAQMLGLPRPAISELEAETRRLSAGELKRLAEVYRVSANWILGTEEAEQEELRLAGRQFERLTDADRQMVLRVMRSLRRSPRGK